MSKSVLMILFSISLAVVGQLMLKAGMNKIGPISMTQAKAPVATVLEVASNPNVVGGLALYGASALVWLIILSRVNLSFAYPMLGFSYVIVMFASRALFSEPISGLRWAGAALISLGVVLITRT